MTTIAPSEPVNVSKFVGESVAFSFTVTEGVGGPAVDISGWGLVCDGSYVDDAPDAAPAFSRTVGAGITLGATGSGEVNIPTTGLEAGVLNYSLRAPSAADKPVLFHGRLTLKDLPG